MSIIALSRHCDDDGSGFFGPGNWSGPSPMDAVEGAFSLLGCEPDPLSVDGARIGHGLPGRPVPLPELREFLLDPATSFPARDAVWRVLVRKARRDGPGWVVAAAGVALPGLRHLARALTADYDGDANDLYAEILAGFVSELRSIDVRRGRIAARLCYAAYNAGRRLRRREAATAGLRVPLKESMIPVRPSGHPDFVLARAVTLGVITADDADLIGRSRLEHMPMTKLAAELGISAPAAGMRRRRAETRLIAALREGRLSDV